MKAKNETHQSSRIQPQSPVDHSTFRRPFLDGLVFCFDASDSDAKKSSLHSLQIVLTAINICIEQIIFFVNPNIPKYMLSLSTVGAIMPEILGNYIVIRFGYRKEKIKITVVN